MGKKKHFFIISMIVVFTAILWYFKAGFVLYLLHFKSDNEKSLSQSERRPELAEEIREKITPLLGIEPYGYMLPFDVAVSKNQSLLGMVENLEKEKNIENKIKILEEIIYKWLQVDNISVKDFGLYRFERIKIDEIKGTVYCYEDDKEISIKKLYAITLFSGYKNLSHIFETGGKYTLVCSKLISAWNTMFAGIWVRYAIMSPSLHDSVEYLKYFAFLENGDFIVFFGSKKEYKKLKEYIYSLLSNPTKENIQKALLLLSVMLGSGTVSDYETSKLAKKILKENNTLKKYLADSIFGGIFDGLK